MPDTNAVLLVAAVAGVAAVIGTAIACYVTNTKLGVARLGLEVVLSDLPDFGDLDGMSRTELGYAATLARLDAANYLEASD